MGFKYCWKFGPLHHWIQALASAVLEIQGCHHAYSESSCQLFFLGDRRANFSEESKKDAK